MKQTLAILTFVSFALTGCGKVGSSFKSDLASVNSSSNGGPGGGSSNPELLRPVAGNGDRVSGTGALSVPTADGLVARIQNAIPAVSSAGNFRTALAQVKSNLPSSTDPTKATGFDNAQLLVYAACSDLTTGAANSKMKTVYNVDPAQTIATNQANLIAAGVKMLDGYTASLASQGPSADQVKAALQNLVTTIQGQAGSTSTIAFMSVCIAANTAGSSMMGF